LWSGKFSDIFTDIEDVFLNEVRERSESHRIEFIPSHGYTVLDQQLQNVRAIYFDQQILALLFIHKFFLHNLVQRTGIQHHLRGGTQVKLQHEEWFIIKYFFLTDFQDSHFQFVNGIHLDVPAVEDNGFFEGMELVQLQFVHTKN